MKKNILGVTFGLFVLSGCNGISGGDCPTVAIPVYSVSVIDAITGESLCYAQLYMSGEVTPDSSLCEISYSVTEGNPQAGDIAVKLDGYQAKIENEVLNNAGKFACFDNPDYTVDVEIYVSAEDV